jgi:hypothetical protein
MAASPNINFWSKVGIHCHKEPPRRGTVMALPTENPEEPLSGVVYASSIFLRAEANPA